MTEGEVFRLLRARYNRTFGNGEQFAWMEHVRCFAGWGPRGATMRTLDAIAMGLWPSRGLEIHGFEIKCSRGDWLAELKQPEKSGAFVPMLDRFFIVAADEKIVRASELPDGWGLCVVRGNRLVFREASVLRPQTWSEVCNSDNPLPPGINRHTLACMLRAACCVTGEDESPPRDGPAEALPNDGLHIPPKPPADQPEQPL